jgi:cytochrome c oxidase subunit II
MLTRNSKRRDSVRFQTGVAVLWLLGLVAPIVAQTKDADSCAVNLKDVPGDQLATLLERLKALNCSMEKIGDEMKRAHPEAWKLLQEAETVSPVDLMIKVTGRQYAWTFNYPAPVTLKSEEPLICTINGSLVVPKGKRVGINLTSDDVIHELRVPGLGLSADAVPGRLSSVFLNTSTAGAFEGGVTPSSGAGYAEMAIDVRVVEPSAYEDWARLTLDSKACVSE